MINQKNTCFKVRYIVTSEQVMDRVLLSSTYRRLCYLEKESDYKFVSPIVFDAEFNSYNLEVDGGVNREITVEREVVSKHTDDQIDLVLPLNYLENEVTIMRANKGIVDVSPNGPSISLSKK